MVGGSAGLVGSPGAREHAGTHKEDSEPWSGAPALPGRITPPKLGARLPTPSEPTRKAERTREERPGAGTGNWRQNGASRAHAHRLGDEANPAGVKQARYRVSGTDTAMAANAVPSTGGRSLELMVRPSVSPGRCGREEIHHCCPVNEAVIAPVAMSLVCRMLEPSKGDAT